MSNTSSRVDCSGRPQGRARAVMVLGYFAEQQWLYEEGYPSVWGYWNRMAEYLMSPYRRIRHKTRKDGCDV